jgi:ABC-type bacteriocin/lantibiotic exporter with double-glycine peptidase domain
MCGPTALSNALLSVGRDIPPAACAELCGITPDGIGDEDLERAIELLDFTPTVVRSWYALRGALDAGAPVVCSVQEDRPYDHWVAAIGTLGELIVVADSLSYEVVKTYKRVDWLAMWSDGAEGRYGVALDSG